jgi:asparagine synthase (glutamine-hydrolysing)
MCRAIVHRGPDESGVFIDGHVGLGHRRLSIVDLKTGQQPMCNEDGTVWIAYNGEFYTHTDFVEELKAKGHRYKSTSDTETIIHLYEEYGLDFANRLRGMFAFALYDQRRNRLVLVRDRIGIKPLYYHVDGARLCFASEIKALLSLPDIKAELDAGILPQYLCNRFVAGADTFFKGIRRLEPGHLLVFEAGKLETRPYWDLTQFAQAEKREVDLTAAVDRFLELFRESVKLRLMSDVPLGLFLSGGIDSSAICAVMSEMVSDRLETFAVGFQEGEANELHYARLVADHYRTRHREIVLDADIFFRALPQSIWHEDEPIAFPSSIPLYFVSQLAQSRVKVVLTGEGSDELLGGYAKYYKTLLNFKWGERYSLLPEGLRSIIRKLIQQNSGRHPLVYKLNRTFLARELNLDDIYFSNFSVFFKNELPHLLSESVAADHDPYAGYHMELEKLNGDIDLADQLLLIDLKTYLHELLMKQDQMSMAASIESRVPFLDHHMIEYITGLPANFKVSGRTTKILLRKAMERVGLPKVILNRPKMGFPVPLDTWFRKQHRGMVESLLFDGRLAERNLFRMEYIRKLAGDHFAGRARNGDRLWSLINFELWARRFIDGEAAKESLPELFDIALRRGAN